MGIRGIVNKIKIALGVIALTQALSKASLAASDLSVVDVRRNIPLADTDPVYRDYHINAGTEHGLKEGMVVKVNRRVTMRDVTGTQSFGELIIPVGQVKILFVQDKIAVARDFEFFSRDIYPNVEQASVMIGDKLDLVGAFIDKEKKANKKSTQ